MEKTMPFKIDFWNDFGGFLKRKWRQVGAQFEIVGKKKVPIKADSKNQLKIDSKSKSTWEGILTSILNRF